MREKFPGHEGGSMGNDTRSVETGDAPLSVSAPVFADERAPGSMARESASITAMSGCSAHEIMLTGGLGVASGRIFPEGECLRVVVA